MKATAVIQGDRSVGIPDYGVEIDLGADYEFYSPEHREAVRKKVAELVCVAYDDGVAEVYFDDDPPMVWETDDPEDGGW